MEARDTVLGGGTKEDPFTFNKEKVEVEVGESASQVKGKGRAESPVKKWTGVTRSGQRASRGRRSGPYG
jgi:hypothetical protein